MCTDSSAPFHRNHVVLDYSMLSADTIVELHDRSTGAWHQKPITPGKDNPPGDWPADVWLDAVACQHRANFDLWHIEDEARTPGASDADLARVKRNIDRTNQLRNDLAEGLDCTLLGWLESRHLPNANAPLNSESPGLMIDRLSILALKIYHTREEVERTDAEPGHVERNLSRLAILETQRKDLAGCLDELWRETLAGTRQFKLYRQLKMYNDPSLNPAMYRNKVGSGPGNLNN
jgi:hypothetical protein